MRAGRATGPRSTATAVVAAAARALGVAVVVLLVAPRAADAKVRVAVPELKLEGDVTPALALQLQDSFVLGLARAGIEVMDPIELADRLEGKTELVGCDSASCLRDMGRTLSARYVVRLKVDVAGNSYKMVARLFSTEASAPVPLPVATKSKTCDVCTVAEARKHMLRLAEAVKPEIEDPTSTPSAMLVTAVPPRPPSVVVPLVAAMAGAAAVATGVALFATMTECADTAASAAAGAQPCRENRLRSGVAGALVGAGAVSAAVGTYVTIARSRAPAPAATTTVMVAFRF